MGPAIFRSNCKMQVRILNNLSIPSNFSVNACGQTRSAYFLSQQKCRTDETKNQKICKTQNYGSFGFFQKNRNFSFSAKIHSEASSANLEIGQADMQYTKTKKVSLLSKFTGFSRAISRNLTMVGIFFNLHKAFLRYEYGKENLPSVFEKTVRREPNKLAIIDDHTQMTFQQLEDYSNRVANVFSKSELLKKNDIVALFGTSSAEYVGLWLGLSKLQMRIALLNSNLLAEPLKHSISAVSSKTIIVDTDLLAQFESIRDDLSDANVYYYNSNPATQKPAEIPTEKWLNSLLLDASPLPLPKTGAGLSDVLMYIYTSGTTGMPKASIITHRRFMAFTVIIQLCGGIRRDEIIYCPLPLYHTAAGITTVGQVLLNGSTIVVRKKFSTKHFWTDVIKYKCTVVQYIGEICRFLLAQPPSELEQQHRLRMAFGQGLRPALWEDFKTRFGISEIREMYGSTEGNAGTANVEGKPGAVGYLSPFLSRLPVALPVVVPIDKKSGHFRRTEKNGLSRHALPGEEGELLGPITKDPLRKFEGYTDSEATTTKIVENVFKKGDSFFRTGDIVIMDEEGFVYFKDRLGDSFRWKGENVSTTEVEAIISKVMNHVDTVVYGVDVPGCDGKAGMACVAGHGEGPVDVSGLYETFSRHLPGYAVPVFLRFSKNLEVTGTFKLQKFRLKTDGYNPAVTCDDKMYYLDSGAKTYKPITNEIYQMIMNSQMRF